MSSVTTLDSASLIFHKIIIKSSDINASMHFTSHDYESVVMFNQVPINLYAEVPNLVILLTAKDVYPLD